MPQPRTSIADLAQLLHLAPSTVSRALLGHAQTSASAQQRVRQTATELGYHHAGRPGAAPQRLVFPEYYRQHY